MHKLDICDALRRLCLTPGVSGFEGPAAKEAAKLLEPFCGEIGTDALGNIRGVRRCGREGAERLLLDAHIDEVGLIVTGHEKGGFLSFIAVGGVDERVLPASEVTVLAGEPLFGVIGCLPPHVQTREEAEKPVSKSDLFIDTGLPAETAKSFVPVGTPVCLNSRFIKMGGAVSCKAFDDRACVAVILRTLEIIADKDVFVDIIVQISVQEEVGTRGAQIGAYSVFPDRAVAVDVGHAETPDASKDVFELGGGVMIGVGPSLCREMTDRLRDIAAEKGIRHQLEVMGGGSGTNAWPMQISRAGVKTALLSLPLRYMHTPCETVSLEDIESAAALLAEYILSLRPAEDGGVGCA